jgi:hypothetical protein
VTPRKLTKSRRSSTRCVATSPHICRPQRRGVSAHKLLFHGAVGHGKHCQFSTLCPPGPCVRCPPGTCTKDPLAVHVCAGSAPCFRGSRSCCFESGRRGSGTSRPPRAPFLMTGPHQTMKATCRTLALLDCHPALCMSVRECSVQHCHPCVRLPEWRTVLRQVVLSGSGTVFAFRWRPDLVHSSCGKVDAACV